MDTFRKWLNKPKADDKSLLARFYHADRSLTAVASELDSFDGRAEPDRCSRLVSRLRQSQDKVLAITNLIMEELLGEDRDPRSFRAKFPEEVLQENLAGQLWFGAECLAAGSSIMNREQESKEMRPLAQAVTKSLGNVRNLLRDQCLRHNVPNSRTLHLDLNDSTTEQLCESLKIFDRLFAEFELRYVSAMVQVKTKHEHEMQELICVLFSETLQRALKIGLLDQDKVDAFDPALMFSIPRLAIIAGLVIYHKGPLNMDMTADLMSEMFRPFRTILIKIRDLLRALNKNELYQLERLLCTNEDIHLTVPVGSSSIEAPSSDQQNNNTNNGTSKNSNNCDKISGDTETTTTPTAIAIQQDNNNSTPITEPSTSLKKVLKTASGDMTSNSASSRRAIYAMRSATRSPAPSVSGDSSIASTPSVSPTASPTPSHSIASTTSSAVSTSTTSPTDWTDEDDDDDDVNEDDDSDHLPKESDIVAADCASGYLIPNTNFGNLLQPQEVPLTDNFIDSEDEFGSNPNDDAVAAADNDNEVAPVNLPSTSTASLRARMRLPHIESSEESEQLTIKASTKSPKSCDNAINGSNGKLDMSTTSSGSKSESASSHRSSSHRHHNHRSSQEEREQNTAAAAGSNCSSSSSESSRHHHHHGQPHRHHHHHHHHHHHRSSKSSKRSSLEAAENEDNKSVEVMTTVTSSNTTSNWSSKLTQSMHGDNLSADASSTSSSLSDGDPRDGTLALRPEGRQKFKSTENLLHRLFVCIAGVADQLQTNFAADLRQILRSVFLMNMSPAQEDIDIPEKTKESELFEFRASENDVIQESAGSNQSIYSAEEVNPELDNVFNNSGGASNNSAVVSGARNSIGSSGINNSNSGASIQRVHTIDMGTSDETVANSTIRNHIGRSRSLGDHENNENTSTTSSNNMRPLSSYINGRRRSSPQRQQQSTTTTSTYKQLQRHRNRNNSTGSNSPTNSSSSSESNSPVIERVSVGFPAPATIRQQQHLTTTSTILNTASSNSTASAITVSSAITNNMNNINNNNNSNNNNNNDNQLDITVTATPSSNARLAPPAWIPDDKAPRCMSCHTLFTAFRRRHHCRNCGGVFCGVCSNSSAPLPKYGLTKAVRVCRNCYVREVRVVNGVVTTVRNNAALATTTAGGS